MAIEKPNYRVVERVGGIELRDYDEYWIAECRIDNEQDLRAASNRAFGRLFNYISGDNDQRQKIAMTAPVQQVADAGAWLVSFVVPRDVALGEIPVPANGSISLRKVPAGRFAVLRYRGVWNAQRFEQKSQQLLAAVAALGLTADGAASGAVYNPPITPPPLRRNEVMVRVKPTSKKES